MCSRGAQQGRRARAPGRAPPLSRGRGPARGEGGTALSGANAAGKGPFPGGRRRRASLRRRCPSGPRHAPALRAGRYGVGKAKATSESLPLAARTATNVDDREIASPSASAPSAGSPTAPGHVPGRHIGSAGHRGREGGAASLDVASNPEREGGPRSVLRGEGEEMAASVREDGARGPEQGRRGCEHYDRGCLLKVTT